MHVASIRFVVDVRLTYDTLQRRLSLVSIWTSIEKVPLEGDHPRVHRARKQPSLLLFFFSFFPLPLLERSSSSWGLFEKYFSQRLKYDLRQECFNETAWSLKLKILWFRIESLQMETFIFKSGKFLVRRFEDFNLSICFESFHEYVIL